MKGPQSGRHVSKLRVGTPVRSRAAGRSKAQTRRCEVGWVGWIPGCRALDRPLHPRGGIEDRRRQLVKVNYRYCGWIDGIERRRMQFAFECCHCADRGVRGGHLIARQTCITRRWAAMRLPVRIAAIRGCRAAPPTTEQSGARLSRQAQEHQDRYDQLPRKHGVRIPLALKDDQASAQKLCLTHFFGTSANLVTSGSRNLIIQHDSEHRGLRSRLATLKS